MAAALIVGCGADNGNDASLNEIQVSGIYIPSTATVTYGEPLVLQGRGVLTSDRVELNNGNQTYNAAIEAVTDGTFSIALPEELTSGSYTLTLVRGDKRLSLGSLNINLSPAVSIPDKAGMTLKGVVSCDGKGVEGVVVSDGFELTTTDKDGVYYLPSKKKNGYVFISIPSGYEVETKNHNEPQFYQHVTPNNTATVEQRDFSLRKVDNDHYKLFVMTDFHLANRNNDLGQYENFVNDVNQSIQNESTGNVPVYGLDLGDLSWDVYWYSNHFALAQCMTQINKVNCPVFHLPGNHDNDPYVADDWGSAQPYKDIVGPTYYSFNLGKVHFVMLDNIQYLNTGGAEGHLGDRNYNDIVVSDQMEWLKKDLATVTDPSTPIVLAMHANFYRVPLLSGQESLATINVNNGKDIKDLVSRFKEVHILTGHTHVNFTVEDGNVMEHNTAAVCATWWWTGAPNSAGNHTCKDGSPGGYSVWDVNGTNFEWYYKGTGKPKDYQFRTYDLNETVITAAKYAPNATEAAMAEYAGEYSRKNSDNEVLLNVWNYDSKWKIEVTENGKPLQVTRVRTKDPLHIISYEAIRVNAGKTPTSAFVTDDTPHLFKVKASSPTSTLEIKVTDRFGHEYTESMKRPKALARDMM